jgi:diguanylate cyclase (GGDEF)-like protein/PAS domain S-box-containing protein
MNFWLSRVVINRFFKSASIDSLLKLWSLVTVGAVISILLLALFSNSLFKEHHAENKLLPLQDEVRKLTQLATQLTLQQRKELHLKASQHKHDLRSEFEARLTQLSLSLDGEVYSQALNKISHAYQQVLVFDETEKTLSEQLVKLQESNRRFKDEIDRLNQRVQQAISSLLVFIDETQIKQFNDADKSELHHILFLLQNSNNNLQTIYERVAQQSSLSQLVDENQKQLINFGETLSQYINEFSQINGLLTDYEVEREKLIRDLKRLQALIYLNDETAYSLKLNILETNSSLVDIKNKRILAVVSLVDDIEQLAVVLNQQKDFQTSDLIDSVNVNFWLIVIIGLTVLCALILFILPISENINSPLQELRKAMHALSQKRFHTRLKESEGPNEFALLATDFNQFADTTQTLITDLADAKVSLESNQQSLLAILNGVPEAILTLSNEGIVTASNPAAERVLAASENELIGKNITQFFVGVPEQFSEFKHVFESEQKFEGIKLNDEQFSLEASLTQIGPQSDGAWVCVITDITDLKKAELRLIEKTSELDAIFENAMVGIAYIKDRKFLRINHKFEELFSCDRLQVEGQSTRIIYHTDEAFETFGEIAYSTLAQENAFQADIQLKRGESDEFWCSVSAQNISKNDNGAGSIWLFEDISIQRENEQRLRRLASFDSLTGLPNRTVFNDRLEHAIAKADRHSTNLAIFFIDLDNFKNINDSLGHKTGDLLLCEVATRLKQSVRAEDTVARLGGDEFTVILEDIGSARFVGKVAEKVLQAISEPYLLEQLEVNISPSVGISLYPSDGKTLDHLVKNADAAMYHAKSLGKNNFQFYSADMNAQANQRLEMESALRKAAENDEFYLHFQPQIDLETGRIVGAEALLRWNSEAFGNVSPAVFVPILEETGLISVVGEYVLRQACLAYLQIKHEVSEDFVVAVNLSGRQFKGGQLANFVEQLLKQLNMPAKNLELEITESMLMDDTQLAIKTLRELSDLGIMLAVDDFGTGYSSLAYLKQFPLNVLKIDRSFVSDVTVDDDDAAIVDAILAISRRLKLDVVAEGIETVDQLSFLQSHGCQRGQGFHFSRPLDLEHLIDFLHQTSVELS